jgi:hypothetical protein
MLEAGRALRAQVPRRAHGQWTASPGRPDPLEILSRSNANRLPELVPVRNGRVTTLLAWTCSFIGRGRAEREFSVMPTGGDLSLPAEVRAIVQRKPLPVYSQKLASEQIALPPSGSDDG